MKLIFLNIVTVNRINLLSLCVIYYLCKWITILQRSHSEKRLKREPRVRVRIMNDCDWFLRRFFFCIEPPIICASHLWIVWYTKPGGDGPSLSIDESTNNLRDLQAFHCISQQALRMRFINAFLSRLIDHFPSEIVIESKYIHTNYRVEDSCISRHIAISQKNSYA